MDETKSIVNEVPEVLSTPKKSINWLSYVLIFLLGILIGVVVMFALLLAKVNIPFISNNRSSNTDDLIQNSNNEEVPVNNITNGGSEESANESSPSATTLKYTDKDGVFEFEYSPEWEILSSIPKKFTQPESFADTGDLASWLKGKMFYNPDKCDLTVLVNKNDDNQLIVLDYESNSEEIFWCPVGGSGLENGDKWQIADSYVYPVCSNTTKTVKWSGDYFLSKNLKSKLGGKYTGVIFLANYETYTLKGEDTFNSIYKSFKFLK